MRSLVSLAMILVLCMSLPMTRAGDGPVSAASDAMGTGRVTDEFFGGFQPGLPRFRQHRRRGVVVEVNHDQRFSCSWARR